jgi:hypothetical protein
MKKTLVLAALALLLSACGGGDSSGTVASTEPPPDAFTGKVLELAASAPETGEAGAIETLTASMPEDTQPMPII